MTVASRQRVDFGTHVAVALSLPGETTFVSHPLFHAMFRLVKILLPGLDNSDVAVLALLSFLLPQSLIVFSLLSRSAARQHSQFLIVVVSFGLTILSPITIWTHKLMLGYVNPNRVSQSDHTCFASFRDTHVFTAIAESSTERRLVEIESCRIYTVLLCASVLLLTTLAKQNYTIALIPGCCIFAVWQTLKRKEVDWLVLVFGICCTWHTIARIAVFVDIRRIFKRFFGFYWLSYLYESLDSKMACADPVAAFSCLSHKCLHFVFSGSKKESLLEFIMDDLWRQHINDILPL